MEDGAEEHFAKRLSKFIEQKHRLILIAILAFAFIIRLKYMTVNAAVWWDEADYLTLAKHYGLGLPEQAAPWRARAIPMLLGVFFWLGANEWFIRLLEALVSVLGVFLTYRIGELFDRKIGLLAAIGMAVYFEFLFWTARIAMDIYATAISAGAMWLFWKGYVEKKGWKYVAGAGALLGFGIFGYESTGFMFMIIGLFLLITEKLSFLKKKEFWIFVIAAIIVATPFLINNQIMFGNIYPRAMQQARNIETVSGAENWNPTTLALISKLTTYAKNIPYIFKWPFFIAFIAGLSMFLNMLIGFDMFFKGKGEAMKKELFIFLWILVVFVLFSIIYAFTVDFEPAIRFLFVMMPAAFTVMGYGFVQIYKFAAKHNTIIAVLLVAGLLIAGIYVQLTFANQLILFKSDSFRGEREAGEWLKDKLRHDEPVVGCGLPLPFIFYTGHDFMNYGDNATLAEEFIAQYHPQFLVVDGFAPGCNPNYPNANPDRFRLVNLFYLDKEKTQPIVGIFEILYPQNLSA